MDSWERFSETSELNDEHITNEEFACAAGLGDVWIQNAWRLPLFIVKTDVALLVNVFENFCKLILSQYGLDPTHYFSSPGLSWDTLLK